MKKLIELLKEKGFKVEKRKSHIRVSNGPNAIIFLDQNTSGELLNVFSLKSEGQDLDGVLLKETTAGILVSDIFPVIPKKHFNTVCNQVSDLLVCA